jgi:hypothetical protein
MWPQNSFPGGVWPGAMWPAPALDPGPIGALTHLTSATFPFKGNFPGLYAAGSGTSAAVDYAISVIEAEWSGIFTMFTNLSTQQMVNKQAIIESYLVGWWLGDMYPRQMRGVQGDGGIPIASKSIGGVSITKRQIESQPALVALTSNAFGVKALTMILSRVERMAILPQVPQTTIPVTTWQDLATVLQIGGIPAP